LLRVFLTGCVICRVRLWIVTETVKRIIARSDASFGGVHSVSGAEILAGVWVPFDPVVCQQPSVHTELISHD
jgi:hypothetical protein